MSSGFVSSGQFDAADGSRRDRVDSTSHDSSNEATGVDAWAAADAAVKAAREKANASSGLMGSQEGGKSLFEVLQANKARKQEAFEEKLKFKNQFRSLDEGEVEFLDSIVSEQRAEEEAKQKEIEARLDDFRKLQYEADHDPNPIQSAILEESGNAWAVSSRKKRKKDKEKENTGTGLKLRKMSDGSRRESGNAIPAVDAPAVTSPTVPKTEAPNSTVSRKSEESVTPEKKAVAKVSPPVAAVVKSTINLGTLVSYWSDSDDDD
ncbi:hypothetical protein ABW19_dt0200395 [Dactylella cylindrospora]|nr:hypothetical protein ABW19_dt0200395 [Dactylella cylindrospora]